MFCNIDVTDDVLRCMCGGPRDLLATTLAVRGVSREWRRSADMFWLSVAMDFHDPQQVGRPAPRMPREEAEWLAAAVVQLSVVTLLRAKQEVLQMHVAPVGRKTLLALVHAAPVRSLFLQIMQNTVGRSVTQSIFTPLSLGMGSEMHRGNAPSDWCRRVATRVSDIVAESRLDADALRLMADPEKVLEAATLATRKSKRLLG